MKKQVIFLLIIAALGTTLTWWITGKSEPGGETKGVVGITIRADTTTMTTMDILYYDPEDLMAVPNEYNE